MICRDSLFLLIVLSVMVFERRFCEGLDFEVLPNLSKAILLWTQRVGRYVEYRTVVVFVCCWESYLLDLVC